MSELNLNFCEKREHLDTNGFFRDSNHWRICHGGTLNALKCIYLVGAFVQSEMSERSNVAICPSRSKVRGADERLKG